MAQYSLEPSPNRRELQNASRLVLTKMKADGYRTQEQTAKAIGIPSSDLNRLLNAKIERKWGFFRLSRIASWLNVTMDELLSREEGTTKIIMPSGAKPESVPLLMATKVLVSRNSVRQIADRRVNEQLRFREQLAGILDGKGPLDKVLVAVENHFTRLQEIDAEL